MRVLLAGGGSAGHTSPLLATADALRRLDATVEVTALGTPRGLEGRVVPELVALGLVVGFARSEPAAAAALRDKRRGRAPGVNAWPGRGR